MARYRAIFGQNGKLAEFEDDRLVWASDEYIARESGNQAPALITDIQPWDAYISPASGKLITSRKERREDMARTNSRPWEGLNVEKQEANRRKQYEEQRNDARLHEAASRAFYQMDPRKRRELMKG